VSTEDKAEQRLRLERQLAAAERGQAAREEQARIYAALAADLRAKLAALDGE
jgi:hypothetical protein